MAASGTVYFLVYHRQPSSSAYLRTANTAFYDQNADLSLAQTFHRLQKCVMNIIKLT
jgi:hypothetical protein